MKNNKSLLNYEYFLNLLTDSDFYRQLFIIGIALVVAWLFSMLVVRLIKKKLPAGIAANGTAEILVRIVRKLLFPVSAVVALGIGNTLAPYFRAETTFIADATTLALAYLLVRIILFISQKHPMAQVICVVIALITTLSVTGTLAATHDFLDSYAMKLGSLRLSVLTLLTGLLTFALLIWLAGVVSRMVEHSVGRSSLSYNARELVNKFSKIAFYIAAFLITLNLIGVDLTAFAVFGGALGVGIGFGLQKITSNFISGIILLMEKTVKVGDLVEVGNDKGWVRYLGIRHTLIENMDGREVMIPNEELILTRVTNWTYSNTKARVDVLLTVDGSSDPEHVKMLLIEIAKAHPRCMQFPSPICSMISYSDAGMQFELNFWVPDISEGIKSARSDVLFTLHTRLKEQGIKLPGPKMMVMVPSPGMPA